MAAVCILCETRLQSVYIMEIYFGFRRADESIFYKIILGTKQNKLASENMP